MAALWESYSETFGLTAVASQDAEEIFHNEVDDHVFASAPITIVDGIVTIITDTDDLCLVDLVIAPEHMTEALVEAVAIHEQMSWYKWFCARGPLVFRLRSKRTIQPEHKLWVRCIKSQGGNATDIHVGLNLLMVRHQ